MAISDIRVIAIADGASTDVAAWWNGYLATVV